MSILPRRLQASSRRDLLIGGAACLVVLALATTTPGNVGMLLGALTVGVLVGALALSDPLLALVFVVLASFLRTAQKEIVSSEMLTPAFIVLLVALTLAVARKEKRPPELGARSARPQPTAVDRRRRAARLSETESSC